MENNDNNTLEIKKLTPADKIRIWKKENVAKRTNKCNVEDIGRKCFRN